MKKQIGLFAFVAALLVPSTANAFFFFFVPGSVTSKIGDALTGAEGDTCVGPNAKVGDVITSPTGNTATVKSLSGSSSRCQNPNLPIRALLIFNYSFSSKAGMNIPEGFEAKPMSDIQRFQGGLMRGENPLTRAGFFVSAVPKSAAVDARSVATKFEANMKTLIDDAKTSAEEELTIGGLRALRFEVEGKNKGLFGARFTYVVTTIDGPKEVLLINAWAPTKIDFIKDREELRRLALGVGGLTDSAPRVNLSPGPSEGSPLEKGVLISPAAADSVQAVSPAQDARATSAAPSPGSLAVPNESAFAPRRAEASSSVVQQPTSLTSAGTSPASQKLRELNGLLKDGLITQGDYEAKKQEILKSF